MRAAARTGIVALLLAACAIPAGCERKKEPAAGGNATAAAVTVDEAAAATYGTENTATGAMRLKDGHYEDGDRVAGDLDTLGAQGDLDGDGSEDRVVLLVTSTGGSGVFEDIYALRRVGGQLVVSAPGFLGDRVEVEDLRIEHGDIVVDLVVQGDNDPLCCPTQHVTYRFRLSGNALVETTGQQRVYLRE